MDNKQPSLRELVLPPELFEMNEELTSVDRVLNDDLFILHIAACLQRPSEP